MHGPDTGWDKILDHKKSVHGGASGETEAYWNEKVAIAEFFKRDKVL